MVSSVKKLFYFLLVLAIIVAVDHPAMNAFYDDTIGRFKMFAREGIKTQKNPGANRVYREMEQYLEQYTDDEKNMLDELTKNNQKVLAFRQSYCINGDFNPVIYGVHLKQFCRVIEKHKTQLNTVIK
jgi:GH25 family lysozyme M1 (1,4-beta-N-acetylmuramidase)